MKRLSINSSQSGPRTSKLSFVPNALVFNNSGSFVVDSKGVQHRGSCIGCQGKNCLEYRPEELSTPNFQAFPHNTSRRVCPTKAISYDPDIGSAFINPDQCIACGLCIQRCPTAAIQLNIVARTCIVRRDSTIMESCDGTEQRSFLDEIASCSRTYSFSKIPEGFSDYYQESISIASKLIPDTSEIIVRNALVNMGIPCNTNAAGNNHNRTEFFGQQDDMIIIGESNSSETDTLSVTRRILDDEAVMISRYGQDINGILPLSVINGFPNKRTDYYEVVHDIKAILGIQICTVTFHVLFILNLFGIKLNIRDFSAFLIDNTHQDLLPVVKRLIPRIDSIDEGCRGVSYRPIK